jgi:hypothetical protein
MTAGNPRVILIAAVIVVGLLGWWLGWFHY